MLLTYTTTYSRVWHCHTYTTTYSRVSDCHTYTTTYRRVSDCHTYTTTYSRVWHCHTYTTTYSRLSDCQSWLFTKQTECHGLQPYPVRRLLTGLRSIFAARPVPPPPPPAPGCRVGHPHDLTSDPPPLPSLQTARTSRPGRTP